MKKVNTIVICKDSFKTQEEFENEIKKAIILLLNNDYIMTVRYDACDKEMGVVVIDYNCADKTWGSPYPYWLTPDEEESVVYDDEREKKGEENGTDCAV
jgi:hypothetical protein